MKLATIEVKVPRETLRFKDYTMKTKRIQEFEIEIDKTVDFLAPITEFLTQMIISDIDKV